MVLVFSKLDLLKKEDRRIILDIEKEFEDKSPLFWSYDNDDYLEKLEERILQKHVLIQEVFNHIELCLLFFLEYRGILCFFLKSLPLFKKK